MWRASSAASSPTPKRACARCRASAPYTAAAIAAIAFDRPANVVDGNVERVVARLFAVETPLPAAKPELQRAGRRRWSTDERPGDWAQALMDLGAMVCTPTSPICAHLPGRRRLPGAGHRRAADLSAPHRQADATRSATARPTC